jgi:hypothetical protein
MTGKEVTRNAQNNMEFRVMRIGDLFHSHDNGWEGIQAESCTIKIGLESGFLLSQE